MSPQNVVLYHYTGGAWTALPTTYGITTQGQVTFTSTSTGFSLYAISAQPGTAGNQTASASTATIGNPAPVSTPVKISSPATPAHAVQQMTTVPASTPAPGLPLPAIAAGVLVILVLIGAGFLIRRWWIRKQNPSLFRKYD
ncbi:PGF-pre-PGF domain-containing protein [Methanoregula sp.]|uniref:PGF-pre-PGF domain-containing protein n=1 Tax=Methanoregula sp. TaxID=2052170 RepID=UPI003564D1A5